MKSSVARLVLDYPRRLGFGWGSTLLSYALFTATFGGNNRRVLMPLMIGLVCHSLSQRQLGRDWARATSTLPISRRDVGLAQWIAVFGVPIIVTIAACLGALALGAIIPKGDWLRALTFGDAAFSTLLAWAGLGFFLTIRISTEALAPLHQSFRRIACVTFFMLWGTIWFAMIVAPAGSTVSRVLLNAVLLIAFACAAYTYHRPDLLVFTGTKFRWTDPAGTEARPSRLCGWNVLRADALRAGGVLLGIFMLSIAGVAILGGSHDQTAVQLWTVLAVIIVAIAPSVVPIPSARVIRSLPRSMPWLITNLVLTALIPQAVLLLLCCALALAVKDAFAVPPAWTALLVPALPFLVAIQMRFGAVGNAVTAGIMTGLAAGMVATIFISEHKGTLIGSHWLVLMFAGAIAFAATGVLWLRQQLLTGRDHIAFGQTGGI